MPDRGKVAIRKVFHKELGEYLKGLRTAQGWGQSEAARKARERGLHLVTRSTLVLWETGKVKSPDHEKVRQIARLYGVPYRQLSAKVFASISGSDPLRQSAVSPSSSNDVPSQEGAHDSAPPGVVEQRDDLLNSLFEIEATVSRQIADIIAAHPEIGKAARRKSGPRRHHRTGRR